MLYIKQLISRDQTITHPLLGTVTCSGLQDSYSTCVKLYAKTGFFQSQCQEFFDLGSQDLTSQSMPIQHRVGVPVLHRRQGQRKTSAQRCSTVLTSS